MTQYARPKDDFSNFGFSRVPSGSSLYTAINETTPDDTNYIASASSQLDSTFRTDLTPVNNPNTSTGHLIHWRYQKDGASNIQVTVRIALWQLDSGLNELFQVAFRRHSNIAVGWLQEDSTLTATEASTITNYAYLRFVITASYNGTGVDTGGDVSWAAFEVPGEANPGPPSNLPPVSNKGSEAKQQTTDDYEFQGSLPGWDKF